MASRITESSIEEFAIELLKKQGYGYCAGPDIAPDGDRAERQSFEEVLLLQRLRNAIGRINPGVPVDAQGDAIKQIQRFSSQELIANNEAFHRMLTEGIRVQYRRDSVERGNLI